MPDTTASQLIYYGGNLWAATSGGLYSFPLASGTEASPEWFLIVFVVALALGAVALGVGAREVRRRRP